MKIFSAKQIYEADKFTIEKQQIGSDELMERAAIQIFNWMHLRLQGAPVTIQIFCGIGNNGGDGIAVARHLQEHGYTVVVHIVNYSEKRSKDFLINLDRLKDRKIWPNFMNKDSDFPKINPDDVVLDAIFGIGLNRNPDQWVIKLIQHINNSQAFILAVDIPSGLFADRATLVKEGIITANYVLSLQAPKLIFFLPETGVYCHQWDILDIGIDTDYLKDTETTYELISKNEVLPFYIPRKKFSHKGTFGHALIIGGSYGKIGAIQLSSKACLYAGSGLVTAFIPKCGYIPLQTAIPEVMVLTSKSEHVIADIEFDSIDPTVIGIGVGLGTTIAVKKVFADFLSKNKKPLVIDADGLNMLAANKKLLKKLPSKTILTPHPKELQRLIGEWKDDFDKLEKTKDFSTTYDCIVVIKGANTVTVYKEKGHVNTTGNPGMATGGSGDVLMGLITGLMAQGYDALQAAIFGVYLHGKAGDIALEIYGHQSLTASAIIDGIGKAFIDLFQIPEQKEVKESEK